MPTPVTFPNVYIEEIRTSPPIIQAAPTAITAFIGRAFSGPCDTPTTIYSVEEFNRVFGAWRSEHLNTYPMHSAIQDFFQNGGKQAVIVRRQKNAAYASNQTLRLVSRWIGSCGNEISCTLDQAGITEISAAAIGIAKAHLFNLNVYTDNTQTPRERFLNVSMLSAAGKHRLDRVLAESSQLIDVIKDADGMPIWPILPLPILNQLPSAPSDHQYFKDGIDSEPLTTPLDTLGKSEHADGMYALEKIETFNLLCIPPDQHGTDTPPEMYAAAMAFCAEQRAILLIDAPIQWTNTSIDQNWRNIFNANDPIACHAAIYFPRALQQNPIDPSQVRPVATCGMIAGVIAAIDDNRGVWKAPAGLEATINGISGFAFSLNDSQHSTFNQDAINCLRNRSGKLTIMGARTLRGADSLNDDYKYLPVKRMALFMEESIDKGTQWAVFEPNNATLWATLNASITQFMQSLFSQGAFQGQKPSDAFFVKCDATTTTQTDIKNGIVNIQVGFAPLKPAEFLIMQIQQRTAQTPA